MTWHDTVLDVVVATGTTHRGLICCDRGGLIVTAHGCSLMWWVHVWELLASESLRGPGGCSMRFPAAIANYHSIIKSSPSKDTAISVI